MFHFYTSGKRQKTFGFLTFSGAIKMKHELKWGKLNTLILCKIFFIEHYLKFVAPCYNGYHRCSIFHSTELELWLCAGSKLVHCMVDVCSVENRWQYSKLEIRFTSFKSPVLPKPINWSALWISLIGFYISGALLLNGLNLMLAFS